MGTFLWLVHFFLIGGILSLPYQICHHGLCCYAGRWLRKFSVKCNPTWIITLKSILTPIRSMLLLEHNQGVEQCLSYLNKPTKFSKPKSSTSHTVCIASTTSLSHSKHMPVPVPTA